MGLLESVRFHHYLYGEIGEQPEGIRRRIRQGVGGPNYLEPGAEFEGHFHTPRGVQLHFGDETTMTFGDENWKVRLEHPPLCFCREDGMIVQDIPNVTGHVVQGTCIEEVKK